MLNFVSNISSNFTWEEFFGNHPSREVIIVGDWDSSLIVKGNMDNNPKVFRIDMKIVLFFDKALNCVL